MAKTTSINLSSIQLSPIASTSFVRTGIRLLGVLVGLTVGGVSAVHADWQEWITDVDIRYASQDNLNYSATRFTEQKRDSAVAPKITFGRFNQLSDATRLRLTGEVEAGKFDKFDKLDYVQVGATTALTRKLGLGARAPWVQGHVSLWSLNVDSNMRDSTIYEIGVKTGKRFTPRFDGQIGLAYHSRDGKSGPVVDPTISTEVFDQDNVTLSLEGGYLITENSALTFGYSRRDGEFNSTCTGTSLAQVQAVEKVKALAFDDERFGLPLPVCAYKIDGKTDTFSLGINIGIGRKASLRIGIERQDGKGDVLEYDNTVARIGFVYLR
jgi:hypothetical protein